MSTKMKTFHPITGFLNYISDLTFSDNGVAYRRIILGRGKEEMAYSVTLFGTQARLAGFEIKSGDKIRLTNVSLSADRQQETFTSKRIANVFSLVATDWEVLAEWPQMSEGTVIDNGRAFQGFANYVNSELTKKDKKAVALLIGGGSGQSNLSVGIKAYGKAADAAESIQKGSIVIPTKISLMPIKEGESTVANKFFLALNEFEIRTKGQSNVAQQSAPQNRQPQAQPQQQAPQPAPDFDSFDDDIPF